MSEPPPELDERTLEGTREAARILALRTFGDPEVAEEVAQETAARLIEAIREGRWRPETSLGTYGRGIARHVIAGLLRQRGRVVPFPEHDPDVADVSPHPLDELVTAEQVERVRQALTSLKEGDRELLRLCFYQGLAPREIADRLGEPSARIRKRKSRALERLREVFFGAARGHGQPTSANESMSGSVAAEPRRSG